MQWPWKGVSEIWLTKDLKLVNQLTEAMAHYVMNKPVKNKNVGAFPSLVTRIPVVWGPIKPAGVYFDK